MWNQKEIAKKLTDRELVLNVYITQGIILSIAIVIGLFVFDSLEEFAALWRWDPFEVVMIGGGIGILIVILDRIISFIFPESWLDDGGINERIFRSLSTLELAAMTLLISFSEELLFRGVIQTAAGLVAASIIFAVVHIRYLGKIVLFAYVVTISFVIGYIYEVTGNLLVTVTIHFIIDFVMGLSIMIEHKRSK